MKKIIIIAVIVLVVILILISLLTSKNNPFTNTNNKNLSPTIYQLNSSKTNNNQAPTIKISPTQKLQITITLTPTPSNIDLNLKIDDNNPEKIAEALKKNLPIRTDSFMIDYSNDLNKFIVTKISDQADEELAKWAKENNLTDLIFNPAKTVISYKIKKQLERETVKKPTPSISLSPSDLQREKSVKMINDFINIMFTAPKIPTINPNAVYPSIYPSGYYNNNRLSIISSDPPMRSNGKVYYSQCDGDYDEYPLPNGCNVCKAGCGPTTVSMILSSYVDSKYTPPYVLSLYKKNNFPVGCGGSSIANAKQILEQEGIKTTDMIPYNNVKSDVVAEDIKEYYKNGWTFVALTNFCQDGCGHFFWIVDIDENDNIWAYDVYYGKNKTPPINENAYYKGPQFPQYRYVFGVKK